MQQRFLSIQPAGIPGQAAVGAQDSMTGNDDRDRIMPDRPADRLRGNAVPAQRGQTLGKLSVGYGAAVRYF